MEVSDYVILGLAVLLGIAVGVIVALVGVMRSREKWQREHLMQDAKDMALWENERAAQLMEQTTLRHELDVRIGQLDQAERVIDEKDEVIAALRTALERDEDDPDWEYQQERGRVPEREFGPLNREELAEVLAEAEETPTVVRHRGPSERYAYVYSRPELVAVAPTWWITRKRSESLTWFTENPSIRPEDQDAPT